MYHPDVVPVVEGPLQDTVSLLDVAPSLDAALGILASRFSPALRVSRLALRVRRSEDVLLAGVWSALPTLLAAGTTHPVSGSLYEVTFDQPLRLNEPVKLGLDDLPSFLQELFEGEDVMSGIVVPLWVPGCPRTVLTIASSDTEAFKHAELAQYLALGAALGPALLRVAGYDARETP